MRALLAFIVVAPLLGLATSVDAQTLSLERRVKAAFLYKFASYASWPAEAFPAPDTPLRIGIAGDNVLAAELERMVSGRTSGGRPVTVVAFGPKDLPTNVHIAFRSASATGSLEEWIQMARVAPALVVTETPGALRAGSMINFLVQDGRVRFEIAAHSAEDVGITLSSRLLSVAQSVEDKTP
jgi:hypothetical protein